MSGPSVAVKMRKVMRELLKVPSRVSADAAPEILRLWRRTWRAGQDPYGAALPALEKATIEKKGHAKIMIDSGDTYRSADVRPLPGAGLALSVGVKVQWNLEPAHNRPARPEFPLRGLPATWKAAIEKSVRRRAREAARG